MKTILVTGATSFIGRHLVERLLNDGYQVYASTRSISLNKCDFPINKNLIVIELDMNDLTCVQFENLEIDACFHLAWSGTRGTERNNTCVQSKNYKQSMQLLKILNNVGCKTVIGAGSQAEYGICETIITEENECSPNSAYGKYKLLTYTHGNDFAEEVGMRFIWPRFFSLYGPDDNPNTLIISLVDKLLRNNDIDLTNCEQLWNFLYIDDAIDGLIKLLESDTISGVFNFAGNETKTLRLFIEEVAEMIESKSALNFGAIPYAPTGVVGFSPSVTKLMNDANWAPKTTFKNGIMSVIAYRRGKYEEN